MVAARPLKQPRLPKHLLLWLLLQLAASVGDLGSLPTLARCALISTDGGHHVVPCFGARYGSSSPRLGRQVLVLQHVGRSPTACDASALGQLAKPCGCLVAVRGGCSFAQKAQVAETAGCRALLIVDTSTAEHQDQAAHPDFGTAGIAIPAALVTREVGWVLLEMADDDGSRQVELALSAARAAPAASNDSEEDRDRGVAWVTRDSAGATPIAAVVARRVTATLVAYHVAAAAQPSPAAPTDYGDDMTTVYVRAVTSAASEGTGTRVWESSMALASWVVARAEQFRGKTVLELGCGLSGLPGFLASKFCRQITWTDGDGAVVAHVQSQLATNRKIVRSSTAVVQVLGWGTGECAEPGGCLTYDVVLGSDLLYSAAQVPLLAQTLEQRVAPGGLALVVMPLARSETHFLAELSRLLQYRGTGWRVSLRELVLSKQDFRFGGARNKSDVSAQWDFAAWHHACNTPHQAACPRAQTLPVSLLEAQKL